MAKAKPTTKPETTTPISRKLLISRWLQEARKPEGERMTIKALSGELADELKLDKDKAYARCNAIVAQLKKAKPPIVLPPLGTGRGSKELDEVRAMLAEWQEEQEET